MSLEPNEVDHVQRDTSQTMLYERYGQAIFGYLRLHAHSPEDAEDLLLEVFLAALEHDNLSAFSPREQLAWLRRVAHPLPLLDAVQLDDLPRSPQRVAHAEVPSRASGFRRRWLTRLNTLAAAMFVAVLVGLLILTFAIIHSTRVGSPPSNDFHLLLEPIKGSTPSQAAMQAASEILSQRFSNFGLSGASINVVTLNDHLAIQVELPHFGGNEQQTIATLVQTGSLEFWSTGPVPVQINTLFDPARYAQENPSGKPEFTGADLDPSQVYVSYDQADHPQISFEMKSEAIGRFGQFTANHINQYLTVTMDKTVIESAVLQSAITGPAVVTGDFTQQQAKAVVADLKAGSLPVALIMGG